MTGPENTGPENTGQAATRRMPVLDEPNGPPEGTGEPPAGATAPSPGPQGRARRFWSRRRLPAALLSLLLLLGLALLLYDVVAVRAGRKAMQWRKTLARELAERPLDDTWVLTGAGIAAVLGLWLLLLALTPGRRGLLSMTRYRPGVRGALHRDTAALVLRDRAMEVAGVQSARVRVKRRKAKVHAVSHFRELDEVRADLHTALAGGIGQLGLGHPPALAVRVSRPGRKG
ncbi:hypothetical protein SLNWT_6039 [Streptomyces albus]|uniref:DUF6286 domain-containing protein n=2 Tax=Streptomyces TaxID=1883 RepID=A0A0B5F4A6_STRA4|nr:hypothetical protein SLNWT_6039 [Streptomyces albus]AOU80718.1 hypothetical protein SLNHY_6027 [Streptomyces albus]AYN36426.1 hypothetical protein DUI70_5932 [Streptomyces albus]